MKTVPSRTLCSFLLSALLSTGGLAVAGEVDLNLTTKPRIYTAKDVTCEVVPDASGTGIRINYNFEQSSANWANVQFDIPALDSLTKITVVAKGSPASYAIAIRNANNKALSYRFGPTTEDDFQTFELDPVKPPQAGRAPEDTAIQFPVSKIFFQIQPKGGTQGYLEISKVTFETN